MVGHRILQAARETSYPYTSPPSAPVFAFFFFLFFALLLSAQSGGCDVCGSDDVSKDEPSMEDEFFVGGLDGNLVFEIDSEGASCFCFPFFAEP
jgi:hypothetical protein